MLWVKTIKYQTNTFHECVILKYDTQIGTKQFLPIFTKTACTVYTTVVVLPKQGGGNVLDLV